jgi:hypothetical protein
LKRTGQTGFPVWIAADFYRKSNKDCFNGLRVPPSDNDQPVWLCLEQKVRDMAHKRNALSHEELFGLPEPATATCGQKNGIMRHYMGRCAVT